MRAARIELGRKGMKHGGNHRGMEVQYAWEVVEENKLRPNRIYMTRNEGAKPESCYLCSERMSCLGGDIAHETTLSIAKEESLTLAMKTQRGMKHEGRVKAL